MHKGPIFSSVFGFNQQILTQISDTDCTTMHIPVQICNKIWFRSITVLIQNKTFCSVDLVQKKQETIEEQQEKDSPRRVAYAWEW